MLMANVRENLNFLLFKRVFCFYALTAALAILYNKGEEVIAWIRTS